MAFPPSTFLAIMKLTSIVAFAASALLVSGQTQKSEMATKPAPTPPILKLAVVQTARGNPADGWRVLKGLTALNRYAISPEPVELAATEVEVQILRFSSDYVRGDGSVKADVAMIDSESILKAIKNAGFRPATIVELLAVKSKLKDVDVSAYGNTAELGGKTYRFQIEFIHKAGQDITQFSGGRVGLFPADWKWDQGSVTVAAVKE